jgi:hypothetical protein
VSDEVDRDTEIDRDRGASLWLWTLRDAVFRVSILRKFDVEESGAG